MIVYPNSGEGWDAVGAPLDGPAAVLGGGRGAAGWRAGAAGVGGCCRVGPAEIAAVARVLRGAAEAHGPHDQPD